MIVPGRSFLFAAKTDAWLATEVVEAAKKFHAAKDEIHENGLYAKDLDTFTNSLKEIAFRMEEAPKTHPLFKDIVSRMAALSDADADDVLKAAATLKDAALPAPVKTDFMSVSGRADKAAVPVNPFRKYASGV